MNRLQVGIIALTSLALGACNTQKEGTNITGTATNTETVTVLKPSASQIDTLEQIETTDGSFAFNTTTLDTADFYIVQTDDSYGVPLFVKPNDNIELNITGTTQEDREYEVMGSEESKRVWKIGDILKQAMAKIDSLNNESNATSQEEMMAKRAQLDNEFQIIVADTRKELKAMIDENPGSMANIFIFPQRIGQLQLINIQEDEEYYNKVITAVNEQYPNNKHIVNFEKQVARLKQQQAAQQKMQEVSDNLQPGTPAPDIALPTPNGETRKLSDLQGKVVLVDFWAAWCKPCRMENPNLVRMYDTYNSKGFEIYSVSLDGLPNQPNAKQSWEQAIEQDNLKWANHVSDLKGWNSQVVANYGFRGIPYTVLVDRDGNILATGLRGPSLEEKLKEIL